MDETKFIVVNPLLGNMRIMKSDTQDNNQSDVQPREISDQMHYDTNEYLGRSQVIQRDNTSKTDIGYKELSDEEFEALKKKIEQNPIYQKYFKDITLNKFNIQVVNKILSDERLFNNENVIDNITTIVEYTDTIESAEIANKILSDERLFNNENVMERASQFILVTDPKQKEELVKLVLSEEKLYTNKNLSL